MTKLDELVELGQTSQEPARKAVGLQISISLKNILVPTDLSGRGKKAVNYAVALAENFGAKLTLLYVDTTPYMDAYFGSSYGYDALRLHRLENLEALDELERQIKGRYANAETCFRCGKFCEEIVNAAIELDTDLIVLSTPDYKWINRLVGHSDAEDVLRRAPCPVLFVHDRE
jgi:nucleotide-binding universal stress UspA family protein